MKKIKFLILAISIALCIPIALSFNGNKVEAVLEPGVIPNGDYVIQSVNSGKVLDVPGGNSSNGTAIWQYEYNGTNAQKWRVVQNSDGTYTLQTLLDTNKCLDIAGGSTADGASVQIYSSNGSAAQKFILIPKGYNAYSIKVLCSGKFLDVYCISKDNGALIKQYSENGLENQTWMFYKQN